MNSRGCEWVSKSLIMQSFTEHALSDSGHKKGLEGKWSL